jgi:hypothetical protein
MTLISAGVIYATFAYFGLIVGLHNATTQRWIYATVVILTGLIHLLWLAYYPSHIVWTTFVFSILGPVVDRVTDMWPGPGSMCLVVSQAIFAVKTTPVAWILPIFTVGIVVWDRRDMRIVF